MSDFDKIKLKHLLSAMELYYRSGKSLPLMPEDLDLLRRLVNAV